MVSQGVGPVIMCTLRVAMAQVNVTVGDLKGNAEKIVQYVNEAREFHSDVVVFPELAITGYPPEDLLMKSHFIQDNLDMMNYVRERSNDITVIVGFVDLLDGTRNAAAIIHDGNLVDVYHKIHLPNYGVFDEKRYFKSGKSCPVYVVNGIKVGINICEDIWYPDGPILFQSKAGAEVIININGSPYHQGKPRLRKQMLTERAVDNEVFVVYVNLVGGQDELIFDGNSMILDPRGNVLSEGEYFHEDLVVTDLNIRPLRESVTEDSGIVIPDLARGNQTNAIHISHYVCKPNKPSIPEKLIREKDGLEEIYDALVLGTHDYVTKTGFQGVLVAMSGGIDSSLVAVIASDALGPENVLGVSMPSRFSSEGSILDAQELTKNIGMELHTLSIEDIFSTSLEILDPIFQGTEWGVAEENIQARIRGNLIMSISNKFGLMVLTTGNKSEMSVGYATIYGDMAGGFAVIKDVPKTLVYQLAKYRNSLGSTPVIPPAILSKPPSAELKANQTDQDNLPEYDILDSILKAYIEEDVSYEELIQRGFNPGTVKKVIALVEANEYKRRQSPPGIRISQRNFGRDRRMPIANAYRSF